MARVAGMAGSEAGGYGKRGVRTGAGPRQRVGEPADGGVTAHSAPQVTLTPVSS